MDLIQTIRNEHGLDLQTQDAQAFATVRSLKLNLSNALDK